MANKDHEQAPQHPKKHTLPKMSKEQQAEEDAKAKRREETSSPATDWRDLPEGTTSPEPKKTKSKAEDE